MLLTQEHKEVIRTTKNFVENDINPFVEQWEAEGIFPAKALFKKMGLLGLLGISKPTEYGGLALDYSFEICFAEQIGSTQCGGIPMAVGVQTNMATPALALHGSDQLRSEFLTPAICGDQVCSIAVSEPDAGSDVSAITTTARTHGEDYIINGSKMWITNAIQADFFCVLANTETSSTQSKHNNKSLIIIPANTPGVSVGDKLVKMGMRSSDTAPVFFDNVRIPKRYRIGEEGKGFIYQMQQFQEERLFGVAMGVKLFEQCIQHTIEYTRERKAFGKALLDNQSIHFRLAELQTELEALRSLLYRATDDYVRGNDVTLLASMCKLKAGKLARELPDACLQFWGGMGYVEDSIINRLYRDARLTPIGAGADEVMMSIICKLTGTLPTNL